MKTAEEIKKEIDWLEMELTRAELTETVVARIEKCAVTGDKHKWRVERWEVQQPYSPIYMRGKMSPVDYDTRGKYEKAQLRCSCGVSLTFEEGSR